MKYKNYKSVYEKVAEEAQNLYYHHLFNSKENSIKKLWNNLNMVCSFKKNKTKTRISTSSSAIADKPRDAVL